MALNFPSNPTNGQQFNDWVYDSNNQSWRFAQTQPGGLPCGAIIPWAATTAPPNWLLCDGSAVSRTTYSSLFAVIGTTYGTGNGSTTFNLPDLRGRVPVGRDAGQTEFDVLGETGGAKTHTLSINEIPSHTHTTTDGAYSSNQGPWYAAGGGIYNVRTATDVSKTSGSSGGGQAHNNLQPYQVVNYIIKTTVAITPGESELAPRVTAVETVNTTQNTRLTAIETANSTTNKSGLVPVIPTSVTVASGTASVNANGLITFSGASSISVNGCFTSAYASYRILFNETSASNYADGNLRLRANGSDTAVSYYRNGILNDATSVQGFNSGPDTNWGNVLTTHPATVGHAHSRIEIGDPQLAKPTTYQMTSHAWSGTASRFLTAGGFHTAQTSYDGFTIYLSSGNFGGTFEIYGYN